MKRMTRFQKLWMLLWPVALFLILCPFRFGILRLALLAALSSLWGGTLWLFWTRKGIRVICLALGLIVGAFFLLPGRAIDRQELRGEYVRALVPYRGTFYVWGGGNRIGIDCSGLVRAGLIDADFKTGLMTVNPRLMRDGFSLWWHNCSAQALGDGYRQETRFLFAVPSLNELDVARLQPGDIAVTDDGTHTLAYLGNRAWIEADPEPMHVIIVQAPTATHHFFDRPMRIMRWQQLET